MRWAPATSFVPGFQSIGGVPCSIATVNGQPVITPAECVAGDSAQHPRFPRVDHYYDDQKRLGITASLQWKPSDNTLISLDGLYADFKGTREEQYLEAPSFSVGAACTAANRATSCGIADTEVVSSQITNGVMYAGTFNDVDLRVEDRFDKLDTKFKQVTLEASQKFGDNVSVNFLGGHSTSRHRNPVQNTLTYDQFNVDNYSYDYGSPSGRNPVFNFGTANLTSPTAWVLSQIRLRAATADNTYDTADLGLNWKVNDEFQIDLGGSWKKYRFDTTELRRQNPASPNTNQETVIPAAIAGTSLAGFSKTVTINGYTFLAPDYFAADSQFHFGDPTAFGGAFALGPGPALGQQCDGQGAGRRRLPAGQLQPRFRRVPAARQCRRPLCRHARGVDRLRDRQQRDQPDHRSQQLRRLAAFGEHRHRADAQPRLPLRRGAGDVAAEPRQPQSRRDDQRLWRQPHGHRRQSVPPAVPRLQLRRGGRMVFPAGRADLVALFQKNVEQLHHDAAEPRHLRRRIRSACRPA